MEALANTIHSVVRSNYVPFQGVNEDVVIERVQRFLSVDRFEILCAIEIVLDRG
jgi:hypothetical protein